MNTLSNSSIGNSIGNSVGDSVRDHLRDYVSFRVSSNIHYSVECCVINPVKLSVERDFKEKINEHLLRIQNYKN